MLTPSKKKLNIFRSQAFISKLFIKLTKNSIDPIIACIQILKFCRQNRSSEEIAHVVPFFSKYPNLMRILTMNSPEANPNEILKKYGTIAFFKYYKKHSIIRRASEKQNWFFLLLSGTISMLSVQFDKCGLTKEEYLTYLIKLRLLNEQNLFAQCVQFNQHIVNIDHKYIDTMPKVKYDIHLTRAQAELFVYFKRTSTERDTIPSISEYIHITYPAQSNGLIDKEAKMKFLIPRYAEVNLITSGDVFGTLISIDSNSSIYCEKDYHTYIALTECDLTFIDSNQNVKDPLFASIKGKQKKICREEIISKYYLYQNIERSQFEENYSKLFSYRILKKGEKMISQGSLSSGIFFLNRGTLEISTKRAFDELDGFVVQLKKSLEEYNSSVMSCFKTEENGSLTDYPMTTTSTTYNNENFSQILQEKRKIIVNQISSKEAIGLNECYDPRTKINYFTVECISESADVFFIQLNAYMYIFQKECLVKLAVLKLIENKIEFYIESIRRYKEKINLEAGLCYPQSSTPTTKVAQYNRYYLKQRILSDDIKINLREGQRKSIKLSTHNLTSKGMLGGISNLSSEPVYSVQTQLRYYSSLKLPRLSNQLTDYSSKSLISTSTHLQKKTSLKKLFDRSSTSIKEMPMTIIGPRRVISFKEFKSK